MEIYTTYALGCKTAFISEKRSKPYIQYGDASITGENVVLRQELTQSHELCSRISGRGA